MAGSGDFFRLGVPPALPVSPTPGAQGRLVRVLSGILGRTVRLMACPDYEAVGEALRRGELDGAWAPPLVTARAEALGARVVVRAVRHGSIRSRAALVARMDSTVRLETLGGSRVAWVDRASMGGHLLAVGWLQERGLDPARLFGHQAFLGTYRAALDALLAGQVELASIFAPPEGHDVRLAVQEIAPGHEDEVRVLACTSPALHDAVVVGAHVPVQDALRLERGLVAIRELPEGTALMREVIRAERFERAPELGHRELFGRPQTDVTFSFRTDAPA
jgi:ABC-type phosphate/phosphonate transport system substrate-binding protein